MSARDHILIRMYVVLTLLSVAPAVVLWQVMSVTVLEGHELREAGTRQTLSEVPIEAMRGAILDRTGRALAVNAVRYDLALDPTIDGFGAKEASFYARLGQMTGRSAAHFRTRVRNRTAPQYVRLYRGLTEGQKEELLSWDVPGVILDPNFERRYNYQNTAAHLLGYVSRVDGHGLAGLEKQYEEYLVGQDGVRSVRRDRKGRIEPFVGARVEEPKHGQTLRLTIDLIRQTIMEEELARGVEVAGAKSGTAVAMDPSTGAILAMANVPTFDPNRPAAYEAAARRNRAITDRFEPGSVFKVVSAVAAVEEDLIAMDDSVDTGDGWAVFSGRTMQDSHAYGRLSFRGVIAHSSNVGTAKTIEQMDRGTFYQYARNMGFGQPTWVDLPGEVPGTLKKPDSWSGTTLTSMSIGYGVTATPLQVLSVYAAFANGGELMQPYVVAERRDARGRTLWEMEPRRIRRVFSEATADTLLPAFRDVVLDGTGEAARVAGLAIAGKTGTARKVENGQYVRKYRATFVGFFPADDPEVALLVTLDEPKNGYYGGAVAGPIFREVARRWIGTFPAVAARMNGSATLPDTLAPPPDVVGQPASIAATRLRAAGYRPDGEAPEDRIVTALEVHDREVEWTLAADSTARLPDLRGLSTRHAVAWLQRHGVEAALEGGGIIYRQRPAAGAPLPERVLLHARRGGDS